MSQLAKALIVSQINRSKIYLQAQFNPKELSQGWTISLTQPPAPDARYLEHGSMTRSELNLTLHFDGYERKKNVKRDYVSKLSKLVDTGSKVPPLTRFVWGNFVFSGAITGLSVKYTMFLANGDPCRAEVALSMKSANEIRQQWPSANPTPQTD